MDKGTRKPTPKKIVILVGSLIALFLMILLLYVNNSDDSKKLVNNPKANWEKLLAEHPYNNRPYLSDEDLKKIPKTDRPDLAMEQDVLMTMDPALGIVPTERKFIANKEAERRLMEKGPISGVTWQERGPDNVGGRTRAIMFDPNDAVNGYKKVWAGGVGGGLWYTNDITATTPTWVHVDDFWDNIAISCIAYNPNNTQEFYVGTGEGWYNADAQRGGGIWKTSNSGSTWSRLTSTIPNDVDNVNKCFYYVNKIVIKENGYLFAATRGRYSNRGGILRSIDGGTTWTIVKTVYTGSGSLYDRAADIEVAANGDLYASFGIFSTGKVFKSINTDNGATGTWTDLSTNIVIGNAMRIELACAPSNSNVIYAIAHGGSGDNDVEWFKKSTDGGINWSSITIPLMVDGSGDHFTRGQAFYDLILAVHPSNTNFVLAGGIDLHRTLDGGSTWTGISHWYGGFSKPEVHADQHGILFRPGASNHVLFSHDDGITFSTDAGNSSVSAPGFSNKNNGYNNAQFYSCAAKNEVNSHYFLGGTQDNGSHQFTKPKIGTTTEVTGGDGAFAHIDQSNPDIQMTSYIYSKIYRSLDGGYSFPVLINESTGHFINPSEYDSQRKILYLASGNDQLRRITGMDATITNSNLSISVGTAQVSALKISPYNDVLFLGIENGRIYKYSDASTGSPSLTRIDNGTTPISNMGWVSSIDVGVNDNNLLVTYSNYGIPSVWETSDGGTTWYNKEGDLPDMPVRWCLYNPDDRDEVLLATEVGVWSTDAFGTGTNSSPTWGATNTNLANTRCDMLKYRAADKMVVVGTHGRGLFTSDIFATTTVADFVVDQSVSCTSSLTVEFTDGSLKPNSSWAWDVDYNGTTDYTTQNPTHTYSSPGIYTVKLTVDNGNVSTTKENLILVMNGEPTVNTGCTLSSNSNDENIYGIGIYIFALGNIDNRTSNNDGYYHNYTCSRFTSLELNKSYNVTIRTGDSNPEGAKVYIDYNDDAIFESGEAVVSFPSNTDGVRTLSFTTPSSGVVMNKGLRLRVLSEYNDIPANACDIGSYGQAEDYTVYFVSDATWTGTTSTDWHTTTNWSYSVVPTSAVNAKIPSEVPHFPVLTAATECKNLTILSGASLTVNPTKDFTVNGTLRNEAGTSGLVIKSDASGTGSLIHSTTNVDATFERYMNDADWANWQDGWHFLSSPVASQAIDPAFTTAPYDFYCWYEPGNVWVNFKNTTTAPTWNTANGSTNFEVGKGYMGAYDNAATKEFTGTLNVADVNVSGLTITGTTQSYRSWHLLGNPFSSALTWDDEWTKTNIAGVAKIWNESNQSYSDLTSSPASEIPATNGFFVQVTTDPGSLTIPESKRVHSAQAFYKSTMPELMLKAINLSTGNIQESRFIINPAASPAYDQDYDCEFLQGYAPQFYSIAGTEKLSTNSIDQISLTTEIPFDFIKNEGTDFSIEFTGVESLPLPAYWNDLKTGSVVNLSHNPQYQFAATTGDAPGRFVLKFANPEIVDVPEITLYAAENSLILLNSTGIVCVEVFNLNGQSLLKVSTDLKTIPVNLAQGIYLVRVTSDERVNNFKVFVK